LDVAVGLIDDDLAEAVVDAVLEFLAFLFGALLGVLVGLLIVDLHVLLPHLAQIGDPVLLFQLLQLTADLLLGIHDDRRAAETCDLVLLVR
jgi:hypothetical protein